MAKLNRIFENADFDPDRADYIFSNKDDESELILLEEINQDYTDLKKVDYFTDEDCKIPLSFTKIKTVEEGIDWYSYYHPEIPEDIIPMLARHQFGGDKIPVKHTRHSKNNKTKKETNSGISIKRGETILTFDTL